MVKPWHDLEPDAIRVAMALRSDIWRPWPAAAADTAMDPSRFDALASHLISRGLLLPVIFLNWNRVPYSVFPCLLRYRAAASIEARRDLCNRLAAAPDRVFVEEVEDDTLAVGFLTDAGAPFPSERVARLVDPTVVESIATTRQLYFFKEAGLHFTAVEWGKIEYLLYSTAGVPRYGTYGSMRSRPPHDLLTEIRAHRERRWTLSPLEQRFLDFLLFRPLLPDDALAELLEAPIDTVAAARTRLVRERLIAPSAYFLDSGYQYFQIYLRFTDHFTAAPVATLIHDLVEEPLFCVAALLEGAYDFVLGVHCDDADVVDAAVKALRRHPAVASLERFRVKWTYKHNTLLRSLGDMTRPSLGAASVPLDGGAMNHLPWRGAEGGGHAVAG